MDDNFLNPFVDQQMSSNSIFKFDLIGGFFADSSPICKGQVWKRVIYCQTTVCATRKQVGCESTIMDQVYFFNFNFSVFFTHLMFYVQIGWIRRNENMIFN